MKTADIDALMQGVALVLREQIAPLVTRIDSLEGFRKQQDGVLDRFSELTQGYKEQVHGIIQDAVTAITVRVSELEHDRESLPDPNALRETLLAEVRSAAISNEESAKRALDEYVKSIPKPKDGESVGPEAVVSIVNNIISALPKPEKGKDAEPINYDFIIGEVVKRIPVPKDGTDADPVDYERVISEAVKRMPSVPIPKDGTSVTVDEVLPALIQHTDKYLANIKQPADGKSVSADDVLPALMEHADKYLAQIPKPQDGKSVSVEDVMPKLMLELRARLDSIDPPKDGKSVTLEEVRPLFDAGFAQWALDFERRAADVFQRAIEKMPKPKDGEDGEDGLGFDDMDMDYDGERTFTFKWSKGERKKQKDFKVPIPLYRGVYKSGDTTRWEAWDMLTYGGSVWRAKCDDPGPPGPNNQNWHLVVKKGADGKDAS